MNKITIIDSIMGSGKTTWSIKFLNDNPQMKYIYVTPFLSEIDRIIKNTSLDFHQPINKGKGKLNSLHYLLSSGANIVMTHSLFSTIDDACVNEIKRNDYFLILDEVLDVIHPYDNITSDDLKMLIDSKCIRIGKHNRIFWNKEKSDYITKYDEFKLLAENKRLVKAFDNKVIWMLPPSIMKSFRQVYILTYLFESSLMKPYFNFHNISYCKKSIAENDGEYKIVDFYDPDKSEFSNLINIYDGKINEEIGTNKFDLSVSWFTDKSNSSTVTKLKKFLYNYFHNIHKSKSNETLWSTYKTELHKLKGKGYTKSFLSCNSRSTNMYSDRHILAYCVNIYLNPIISNYFALYGIKVNTDLYALSQMLQWIWRSRIRNGKSVNIYIPSKRMRDLLTNWLNDNL